MPSATPSPMGLSNGASQQLSWNAISNAGRSLTPHPLIPYNPGPLHLSFTCKLLTLRIW